VPPTFADLGVPEPLCARLARRGIAEPFAIQTAALPDALAGRDVCGRAPTGSGKTLAFGLAIAMRVGPAAPRRPRALVLVPTRELAAQVANEIRELLPSSGGSDSPGPRGRKGPKGQGRRKGRTDGGQDTGNVLPIYGGAGYGPQRRGLARGAAVVVACPGRLEDLVEQGDVDLGDVDLVVLDEADRMADMGFLPAVRRLLDRTNARRQTLLFSATLDGDVDSLVKRYQRDPVRHEAVLDEADIGEVEHRFWRTDRAGRAQLAADVVNHHGRAIVFSRTRRGADRLARQLSVNGVTAVAIHGDRSQGQRERALSAFSLGRVSALVATDVAARGIHVDDVACVVHYDLPGDSKDYIHRSGRTGRAGASGVVVSFVLDEDRRSARALQRALGLPQVLDAPDIITGRPSTPRPVEPQHRAPATRTVETMTDDERSLEPASGRSDGRDRPRQGDRRQGRPSQRRPAAGTDRRPKRAGGRPAGAKSSGGSAGGTKGRAKPNGQSHGNRRSQPRGGAPASRTRSAPNRQRSRS
jgi:superfamily II DNA/RNA helicase